MIRLHDRDSRRACFADALDRVIGDQTGAEAASFMRASIADHEQDQHIDAADHLINGLRDCALSYLRPPENRLSCEHRCAAGQSCSAAFVLRDGCRSLYPGDEESGRRFTSPRFMPMPGLWLWRRPPSMTPTRPEYGALMRTMLPDPRGSGHRAGCSVAAARAPNEQQ